MTSPASAEQVTACRSCGAPWPTPFLDLGTTPVANALLERRTDPSPAFPLQVGFCETCSLVQLLQALPVDAVFDEAYPYFSSYSETLCAHAARHVAAQVADRGLNERSLVVEVGSNDGYLLRNVVAAGVRALGVEPSPGPARAARGVGVPTLEAFLTPDVARQVRAEHGPADVVVANNVMAHVPDLNGFVEGLSLLLADNGVLTVENHGVRYLIEHAEFDTVYHEHFCYFSTTAVQTLMARHGLKLLDVEVFPNLQGGALRWYCGHSGQPSPRVQDELAEERAIGLLEPTHYADFAARVTRAQDGLRALLRELKAGGSTIAAYGAAAKGATLLNSSGIGTELVDFVVDCNPHKQGRLMPGARLPILDPAELLTRRPDYVLVLAWNLLDEIVAQQGEYLRGGGQFIVPVPEPAVVPRPEAPR